MFIIIILHDVIFEVVQPPPERARFNRCRVYESQVTSINLPIIIPVSVGVWVLEVGVISFSRGALFRRGLFIFLALFLPNTSKNNRELNLKFSGFGSHKVWWCRRRVSRAFYSKHISRTCLACFFIRGTLD